jgi:Tol biopolymer transport system component
MLEPEPESWPIAPPPPIANHVGALPPATRLWVQSIDSVSTASVLTPADQYVDSFSWSPDGREIAYAFSPFTGFLAPYASRIFAVPAAGGTTVRSSIVPAT